MNKQAQLEQAAREILADYDDNRQVSQAAINHLRAALAAPEPDDTPQFDPDKPMCQDDYEYFTKTGTYTK